MDDTDFIEFSELEVLGFIVCISLSRELDGSRFSAWLELASLMAFMRVE